MKTLAPVQLLELQTGGHHVAVTARPTAWPAYFDPAALAEFRQLDWYVRRARHADHDCYLTATRVFVGMYGGDPDEVAAQRAVIAEVVPDVRAAGVPLPPAAELCYSPLAGAVNRRSPGFLTPTPIRTASGVVIRSIKIDY